jgi:thiol-disulfide isomerase/thioredoxin
MEEANSQPTPPQPASGGISPLIVIFAITGFVGLIAALALLLSEDAMQPGPQAASGDNSAATWQPSSNVTFAEISNRPAPPFEVQTLEGEIVSLEDYLGRPVFLNFWGTWCVPCIREMPAFEEFTQEQGEDGAVVLVINQGETPDQIRAFLNDLNVTGLNVLIDEDLDVANDYGVSVLPTTYLIDAQSQLRFFKLGEVTKEDLYTYLDALEG